MPRFKVCKSFKVVKTARGPAKRCRSFEEVNGLAGLDARLRRSRKRKSRKLYGYEGLDARMRRARKRRRLHGYEAFDELDARLRRARKRRRARRGFGMVEGMASKCARHKLVRSKTGKKVLRCAHFVHGPGVMAYAARKKAGVKRPLSDRALFMRESRAMAKRQGKAYSLKRELKRSFARRAKRTA